MLFTDIIRRKRDGGVLDDAEIEFFVAGLSDGSIPAEQVASLAMAVFFNGMTEEEAAKLTMAMAASGSVLDWKDAGLDGPVVDKHSTGGVGDKVSFLLAPIAAACGCYVPMISGRGLGHTGGTTDKAESIPGYRATPDFATFRRVVKEAGCAIIGQTSELAPADRRFYAIRDVTATVESVPLITASILSKKIAAGLAALVMDIKVGSGAFMRDMNAARELAHSIIATAGVVGLHTHALITDMNECLGTSAGNALEIAESVRFLRNESREARLEEVVLSLCAEMLVVSGLEPDRDTARKRADDAVTSGRAAVAFGRMVSGLGGPADFVDNYERHLPCAKIVVPAAATRGYVQSVDAFKVGNAVIELGGGRRRLDDVLDLSVGLSDVAPVGAEVGTERPLALVHAADRDSAAQAVALLQQAYQVAETPAAAGQCVYDILESG